MGIYGLLKLRNVGINNIRFVCTGIIELFIGLSFMASHYHKKKKKYN
jgi:hypothetical protein